MIFVPAAPSLLMSSIFVSGGMTDFSFCSPSRGPTSTIRTKFSGRLVDVARERLRVAGEVTDLRGREQEATAALRLRESIMCTVDDDEVNYVDQEEYAESSEESGCTKACIVVEHRVLMGVLTLDRRPMTSSCGESTHTHCVAPALYVGESGRRHMEFSALRVHLCGT